MESSIAGTEQVWLSLSGQKIIYQLIQSTLARRVYLKISLSKGLEIVVPRRFSMRRLPEILREKERWILKNLQKINERQHEKNKLIFEDGAQISILGIEKSVHFLTGTGIRSSVRETGESLHIHKNSAQHSHKAILEKHLHTKAKIHFIERTREIATHMGLHYGKLTVRAQKSRWGSCSRAKNLNFNWRLIMTPPEVADYVIIHELAHTVHHNHSKAFYDLVERFCPDYKNRRAFLKRAEFAI